LFRIGMPLALLAGAITLTLVDLGNAQTSASSEAAQPEAYRPSFGDLMTIAIQPRHIKLGLAGQEKIGPTPRTNFASCRALLTGSLARYRRTGR